MIDSYPKIPEVYHVPGFHEPIAAISHLAGAVIFLFLGALLLRRGRGDWGRLIYLGIYAGSCVLLFSMSGVYHMMARGSTARVVMERLDHAAIFVLVAGTFTPVHGLLFRGWLRWGPLAIIWGAAIAGITLKTIFFDSVDGWVGLALYIGLGWFGVFGAGLLAYRYGFAFVVPCMWGGVFYTAGALMDFNGWLVVVPGWVHPHELFHFAVLVGALCHWWFIWQFARGDYPAEFEQWKARQQSMPPAAG